jgi:hypothetical protein
MTKIVTGLTKIVTRLTKGWHLKHIDKTKKKKIPLNTLQSEGFYLIKAEDLFYGIIFAV